MKKGLDCYLPGVERASLLFPLLIFFMNGFAQTISGTIKDKKTKPVAGTIQHVTDTSGSIPGHATVRFRFHASARFFIDLLSETVSVVKRERMEAYPLLFCQLICKTGYEFSFSKQR